MIRVENIPVELKAERAWCWWKYEKRNGKPAKVPCTADGTPIDVASAHPVVFSFDAVMEAVREGFGAGYIFLPENGKTGIDLDHCIEQGRISAPAREIIRELDSYSEISPSGTGVHILARGKLPGPRRKKDRFEMYDTGRYFTMTGNVLEGGPTTVNDRQDQLGALYHKIFPESPLPVPDQQPDEQSKHFSRWQAIPDAEIIRLLCSMAGYFKLWNGNIEEQAGDQSAADFKLCCRLAYYTGRDRERIDRLFRQSKLMRPKWNEKRGAQTYGQLTVIKAVAKQIEVWEPVPRVELFDTFESFENAKPPSYAIEGFLPHEGATGIAGLSGHSKTLMMLAMAKAQFMGPPHKLWGLFPVTERVEKIIYLIPECGRSYFKQRLKLFGIYDQLYIGRLLVRTMSQGPAIPLSDPELLRAAKDATVYLDTAIRFMQGDENSAGDNQRGLATDIFRLLNAGAKVAPFAHHSGKAFRKEEVMTLENVMRGTGDLGAMCAAVWGVKQIDETLNVVHVQCVKARDFSPCGAFQLIGRPRPGQSYIESEGDFQLHKSPEECGSLADEQPPPPGNRERQQQRSDRVNMVKAWFKEDPNTGIEEMTERFAELGIHVKRDTVVRYREEARKNA